MQTVKTRFTLPRPALVWALAALAVVGVLGLFTIRTSSERACVSCHQTSTFKAGTRTSPHAEVGCKKCHLSPGATGTLAFVAQSPLHTLASRERPANRDAAAVPDSRCLSCHKKDIANAVESNGIRIRHSACAASSQCTDCHSTIAHGAATKWVRSYDMNGCLDCHMASGNVSCDLCHQGREETERVKSTAFSVTHGPQWRTTHAMGDTATCTVCHSKSDCAGCHGAGVPHEADFVNTHVTYAVSGKGRCSTCHPKSFCNDCHGTQMPHPSNFVRKHAAVAKKKTEMCNRCHDKADCTKCHEKHVHPGGAVRATPVSQGGAL